ncbi:MAG: type II toxin-antitoxin system PemK/MazF family toxin [Tunicatimonas sp.]|uniref:type II toxin-antitoxin system PemK/MazF family toxin n=1 Tax=Tunicatimonas sp. TaxID=1940096 RepID=UPI003C7429B3
MKEGDIALASLQQADGQRKLRPVLLFKQMPPYQDWLVCGISSQLRQAVANFDEVVQENDDDFLQSGLTVSSVIRLGFLATLPSRDLAGVIGQISQSRYQQLIENLIDKLS